MVQPRVSVSWASRGVLSVVLDGSRWSVGGASSGTVLDPKRGLGSVSPDCRWWDCWLAEERIKEAGPLLLVLLLQKKKLLVVRCVE